MANTSVSSDSQNTCHSDNENPISGIRFLDSPINTGKNQIIFYTTDFPHLKVDISKPFDGKTRLEVYIPKIKVSESI